MDIANVFSSLPMTPDTSWLVLSLNVLCILGAVFLLVQTPIYLLTQSSLPAIAKRRVYLVERRPGQLKDELKSSARSLIIDCLFIVVLIKAQWIRMGESSALGPFLFTFIFMFAWSEVWFYSVHRLMHTRRFYFIHRLHHKAYVSDVYSGTLLSVYERSALLAGLAIGFVIASLLNPLSLAGMLAYLAFNTVFNFLGHSNIEIFPSNFKIILAWGASNTFHSMHHARHHGNYGLFTRVLDRLFGTEFPDYIEAQRRAWTGHGFSRLAEKAVGEDGVKSGPRPDLRTRFNFEPAETPEWAEEEIHAYVELGEDQDPTVLTWHIRRGAEVFGPLKFAELCQVKARGSLNPGDVCFSLEGRCRLDLERIATLNLEFTLPALHVNRRAPRSRRSVHLDITAGEDHWDATTIDISIESASILTSRPLVAGATVRVSVPAPPDGDADGHLEVNATVLNPRRQGEDYRYALRFVDVGKHASRRLSQLLRNSPPAA